MWSPGTSHAKPVRVALFAKWPESCFRAALLKVVVVDLNISSDLLGGINLCECKLDFRWNLWELMETEFSRC